MLGPAIAIFWTLGVLGALDFRLNLFINVITPLILVSGFSDSMHLVMSIRRDILSGMDRIEAARNAVLDVAPACLLTAMNQAISIVSFAFADSALIRTFGFAALMAVGISLYRSCRGGPDARGTAGAAREGSRGPIPTSRRKAASASCSGSPTRSCARSPPTPRCSSSCR
ncbi:MAG: hypothetical protein WDN31_19625 [Hyphomicrobium sp.]